MVIKDVIQNLKSLSDEDAKTLRVAVLDECERRDSLSQIPNQISDLAKLYLSGGGTESTLSDAIDPNNRPPEIVDDGVAVE